jgi:peptidyl-prolyl cis-trans isomerase C
MIRLLCLLAAGLLTVSACSRNTPASSAETAATAPAATPSTPAPAPAKPVPAVLPDTVARVNGETITKTDFESALREVEGRAGGPVPADQRDRIYREVLDQMISFRLLVQETRARNIAATDAEIDARIAEIEQQFPTAEAFRQTLEQRKMTVAALRADAREGIVIDKLLQSEFAGRISVSREDIDGFYQKNPSQFQQPERVRASHILIRFPDNANAAAKQQVRSRAEEILRALKAGNDFVDIAKTNSQDPGSAANGGDLGYFERGQMVGPFEETAFSLRPGQTSELVETEFGYHIIKVADKQASRTVPLDEVRPQIQQFLEGQEREEATQSFVESLKAKSKVEILI